jgi:hypothetical protein
MLLYSKVEVAYYCKVYIFYIYIKYGTLFT